MRARAKSLLGLGVLGALTTFCSACTDTEDAQVLTTEQVEDAASTTVTLKCQSLTLASGSIGPGQTHTALAARDQSGTADAWLKYVEFAPASNATCTFTLPQSLSSNSLKTLSLKANYRGPEIAYQRWAFEVLDPVAGQWGLVADNGFASAWRWTAHSWTLPDSPSRYVSHQAVKIRFRTDSSADAALLDEWILVANLAAAPPVDAGAPDSAGTPNDSGPRDTGIPSSDGASGPSDSSIDAPTTPGDAPSTTVTYPSTTDIFLNPERGFYTAIDLAKARDLTQVRPGGKSLVYGAVHLEKYLGANHAKDLPAQLLTDLRAGFAALRSAGIKAVVRFVYDDGQGYPAGANDAPKDWMIKHIQQLGPIARENQDVTFAYQMGFVGAWGEDHTSKNFPDGPAGAPARKEVLEAMLANFGPSRTVLVRMPAYKRMYYGQTATNASAAFSAASSARVGHFNDCFVSGADDVGTYQFEPVEVLKTYLASDTTYVPIGGETCAVHARNSCATTTAEMKRLHWTFINNDYHPEVLATWKNQGCRPDIERQLGYRLSLVSGSFAPKVLPGGSFNLEVRIKNDGWATVHNPRPLVLVLDGPGGKSEATLLTTIQRWLPGEHTLRASVRIPSSLATGSYRLALWMPDGAASIRDRPEYAIRLANQSVWNSADGTNTMGTIAIDKTAPGSANASVTKFEAIVVQ